MGRVQVRAHHDAAFKFHMQRRAETTEQVPLAALHNFWSQLHSWTTVIFIDELLRITKSLPMGVYIPS